MNAQNLLSNQNCLTLAIDLIQEYLLEEFGSESITQKDFYDLSHIPLAYTELSCDPNADIQVSADVMNYRLVKECCGGDIVFTKQYGSLKELIENELVYLDFAELICLDDEEEEAIKEFMEG